MTTSSTRMSITPRSGVSVYRRWTCWKTSSPLYLIIISS